MSVVGNLPSNNVHGFGLGYGPGMIAEGKEMQDSTDVKA